MQLLAGRKKHETSQSTAWSSRPRGRTATCRGSSAVQQGARFLVQLDKEGRRAPPDCFCERRGRGRKLEVIKVLYIINNIPDGEAIPQCCHVAPGGLLRQATACAASHPVCAAQGGAQDRCRLLQHPISISRRQHQDNPMLTRPLPPRRCQRCRADAATLLHGRCAAFSPLLSTKPTASIKAR
jgi:hypothetical protein